MKLPGMSLFLELIKILQGCPNPYAVAARLTGQLLGTAEELRQEMDELLDDMSTLADLEKLTLPEAAVAEAREFLREMGQLRLHLAISDLFDPQTRKLCGRQATPLLALAVFDVFSWVELASEWLESVDDLRIRIDAQLGQLLPDRPIAPSRPDHQRAKKRFLDFLAEPLGDWCFLQPASLR